MVVSRKSNPLLLHDAPLHNHDSALATIKDHLSFGFGLGNNMNCSPKWMTGYGHGGIVFEHHGSNHQISCPSLLVINFLLSHVAHLGS